MSSSSTWRFQPLRECTARASTSRPAPSSSTAHSSWPASSQAASPRPSSRSVGVWTIAGNGVAARIPAAQRAKYGTGMISPASSGAMTA